MASTTDIAPAAPPATPAIDAGPLDVAPAEVRALWRAFNASLLEQLLALWPSWGFCSRHAWGFTLTEVEIRERPFSAAILYGHFIEGAVHAWTGRVRTWRSTRAILTPSSGCFICERLESDDEVTTEEGPDWNLLAKRVNQRQRIHEQFDPARAEWTRRACPACVAGGGGLVCRPHLLQQAHPPIGVRDALALLDERLERFIRTMTWPPSEASLDDRLAFVETLSWFGGWDYVGKLLSEDRRADTAADEMPRRTAAEHQRAGGRPGRGG